MTDKEHADLNRWIAEHVFGWTRWNFDNGFSKHNYLESNPAARQNKYRRRGFVDGLRFLSFIPKFSTSPADAMMVLERCADKIGYIPQFNKAGKVWCVPMTSPIESAETLPLAICKFSRILFEKNA